VTNVLTENTLKVIRNVTSTVHRF